MADDAIVLGVGDRQVRVSSPDKVLCPESGWRKRDVVDCHLTVADATVVHLRDRPCVLKSASRTASREPFFFQKRTPKTYGWLETAIVTSRAAATPRRS